MVSKYENDVWTLLSFQEIKSTNQILEELEARSNKTINWFSVYKILKTLEEDGKVKLLKNKSGLFWIKK